MSDSTPHNDSHMNALKNGTPRSSMNMPAVRQGMIMPTGPLVSVAALMRSIAITGKPRIPPFHHRNRDTIAPTVRAVSIMSTLQFIPAR